MLRSVYRLVEPFSIEPIQAFASVGCDDVVVRPTFLSICNADQRYYQGNRSSTALSKKLPMALIHEGIGYVVEDKSNQFFAGQRVVIIPNLPIESDPNRAENYIRSSSFCGSGFDGFMQELIVMPASRLIPIPDILPDEIASFTELASVAMHAVDRFEKYSHKSRDVIGIWGDGNLGFLVALMVRQKFPDSKIVICGRQSGKLANFTFVDSTVLSFQNEDIPHVDHAFECCGGEGSESAISQIIDRINPEGSISLLGVSENPVHVDTRMVLEKGLKLFGSSRSGRNDFENVLALYNSNPSIINYLESLISDVVDIKNVKDMSLAFESDIKKISGKTIMKWEV